MLRKFKYYIFVFAFSFCIFGSNVSAFDTDKIKLSNSIQFPWLIIDTIDIGISSSYKDNNSFIKYQFISVTEAQTVEFNKGLEVADENYKSCKTKAETDYDYKSLKEELTAQGKDYSDDDSYNTLYNNYVNAYNSCVKAYNAEVASVYSKIPSFDESKWVNQNMTNADSVKYSIAFPSDLEYFVMWINAKDDENNDIYNVGFLKNDNYKKDEPIEDPKQDDTTDEVVKPDDSKEEVKLEEPKNEDINKEESKEETKKPVTKPVATKPEKETNKNENIKNPDTGVIGVCGISIIAIILLIVLRKKTFISKI